MKIVMAPVNISGQPITLVRELQRRGIDISLIQFAATEAGHKFGYETDRLVLYDGANRADVQLATIEAALREGVEIFHFWLRSMFFSGVYDSFTGFDIPIIKQYGRKIIYRFTGEDLRIKSIHIEKNPYNAYRYGYSTKIDEYRQRMYLDFLREHVDQFVVQDIELQEYCPDAVVIPRSIDLTQFDFVGPVNKERPLVVHAPSNASVKGTSFVRSAVAQLQDEGLAFDYREISDLSHQEAVALYRSSDIVIDQLHIGWYGVLCVEAMALGKTVLTYIRDELFERAEPRVPIVNVNPDTVTAGLRATIKDYDRRAELGRQARDYVERVHAVKNVGDALVDLYERRAGTAPQVRDRFPTLDYFSLQYRTSRVRQATIVRRKEGEKMLVVKAELVKVRRKARKYEEVVSDVLPPLRAKARALDRMTPARTDSFGTRALKSLRRCKFVITGQS